MALIKDITLENGIPTNYHRIGNIGKMDNTLNVIVLSYVNKHYREESVINQVNSQVYSFEDVGEDISFRQTYQLLKTIEPFIEALDD